MNPPESWCQCSRQALAAGSTQLLLLLGGTDTAAVPGISAAGATAESRRFTAAADAELLWRGPGHDLPHQLPPLPAGVTPALISWAAQQQLQLPLLVIDAGAAVPPAVPHIQLGLPQARCLSSGAAMKPGDLQRRLQIGRQLGAGFRRRHPAGLLVLAECVPGGTSTAQAVLTGLGLEVSGVVSGSLRHPPHDLRQGLVQQGLQSLTARHGPVLEPLQVLAGLGDPFQALGLGVLQGVLAPESSQPGLDPQVLLAGGSQMLALQALHLALLPAEQRAVAAAQVVVATTGWLMGESGSNLAELARRIALRWGAVPQLAHAALRFDRCDQQALRDYEQGYVKEGVGAGAMAWLWELSGHTPEQLAAACDAACARLLAA